MAKQRCTKHPFYYEPCSVCSQFKDLESTIAEQNKDIEIMFENIRLPAFFLVEQHQYNYSYLHYSSRTSA